jgi:hypothetical protein
VPEHAQHSRTVAKPISAQTAHAGASADPLVASLNRRAKTKLAEPARLLRRRAEAAATDAPAAPIREPGPQPIQPAPNRTGLPDRLKAGVEVLSGLSMDDVRVHRNSSEPAKLGALAYAKGNDIHLAPGQQQHLPHEAWHVVQQKQGRVRRTAQLKTGTPINDDPGLEREADVMTARALLMARPGGEDERDLDTHRPMVSAATVPVQRLVNVYDPDNPLANVRLHALTNPLNPRLTVGGHAVAMEWLDDDTPRTFPDENAFMDAANEEAPNVEALRHRREDAALERYYGDPTSPEQMGTSPIPAELQAGLNGLNEAAASERIFWNVNHFPFRYTGQYVPPRAAFTARQGDCRTLVGLYQEVARANRIPFEVDSISQKMLVEPRSIHGRTARANTHGGTDWYFQEHFWAIGAGTPYDVLFMVTPPPAPVRSNGSNAHGGATYFTFTDGRCLIEPAPRFGRDITGEGRVFANAAAAERLIAGHP